MPIFKLKLKIPALRFAFTHIADILSGRSRFSFPSRLQNRLKNNMANDSEHFLGHVSQPIVQIPAVKEAVAHSECPPPTAFNTNLPAEIQGDITVESRGYQLEMLEESLKRNVIVTVCLPCSTLLCLIDNSEPDGHRQRQNTYVSHYATISFSNLFPLVGSLETNYLLVNRAVLRIKKELEIAPAYKVSTGQLEEQPVVRSDQC